PRPAAAGGEPTFAAPDLAGTDVLLAAPSPTEALLVARRLMGWGARTCLAPDPEVASAMLPERTWQAIIVDHALGGAACAALARARRGIAGRIVLTTPAERHALPDLKQAGFTGYLVKPVRAASLAARMSDEQDTFERAGGEATTGDAADTSADESARGLAVLIAEDNEINALLAQSLLPRPGPPPKL